jgi:hypothetical protein
MSDKSAKKKPKKASRTDAQPSVLGSLPATRPSRIGRTRATNGAKPKAAAGTSRASTPRIAAAKPRARAATEQSAPVKPETGAGSAAAPGRAPRQATPPATPPGVGEVAQIGVTLGRRVLSGALSRIPRP